MGIFDRSSSTTQNVENTLNQPIQLTDSGAATAAGVGGNVTIINTDQNAFDDSRQLAESAIAFAQGAAQDAVRLSIDSQRTALVFGEQALAETTSAARDFADNLGAIIGDVTGRALSFVRDTTTAQQKSLGETVTNLNAIARESSKSTDERVAEISAGAQRTVLYAVLALAAAVAVYAMVKR